MPAPHIDPNRFTVHTASPRGFAQAYVQEGAGGVPLVCVHGNPGDFVQGLVMAEYFQVNGFRIIAPSRPG